MCSTYISILHACLEPQEMCCACAAKLAQNPDYLYLAYWLYSKVLENYIHDIAPESGKYQNNLKIVENRWSESTSS